MNRATVRDSEQEREVGVGARGERGKGCVDHVVPVRLQLSLAPLLDTLQPPLLHQPFVHQQIQCRPSILRYLLPAYNRNSHLKHLIPTHFKMTSPTNATIMADPGEKSLDRLLSTLTTILHPSTYVFATIPDNDKEAKTPPLTDVQLLFRESEGITVIVTLDVAQSLGLEYFFPCRMVTLNVTSSLEAVGFMAVVATRLAERNMGVNPVSGFYHDHLFVPVGREDEAIRVLDEVAREHRKQLPRPIATLQGSVDLFDQ